jgi:hypothetical protein
MDSSILDKQCCITKVLFFITENEVVTLANEATSSIKIKTNSM